MSTVRMYELIRKANTALTDTEAEELVREIENLTNQRFDDRKELLATKEDLFSVRSELKDDIASVKVELKGDIASVKAELKGDIASGQINLANTEARIIGVVESKIGQTYRSLLLWIVITSFLNGILSSLPEIIALFSR